MPEITVNLMAFLGEHLRMTGQTLDLDLIILSMKF
jgi:hypothetical protein